MIAADLPLTRKVARPWLPLARALVLASAGLVALWSLTFSYGLVAGAVGFFGGALLGERAAAGRWRTGSFVLLVAAAGLLGVWLSRLLVDSAALAELLGPISMLRCGEALLWAAAGGTLASLLRFLAERVPVGAVFEVLAVALALAWGFAAHREGRVHRPLEVGDWAWSRGIDPVYVFLLIGGLGTLLLASLLIREPERRRLPAHFLGLLLVAVLFLLLVKVQGVPRPDPAGDLGLTGEPQETQEGEGESQGGSGGQSDQQMEDLEFRDEYQSKGEVAPVAVVLLHDDYSPPPGVFYFRQTAFSQWNGRRLVTATRDDLDRDVALRFPSSAFDVEAAPALGNGRKALRTTVGLLADHVRPFGLDSPARLAPISNPDPVRFLRVFEVRSHVQTLAYEELLGLRAGDALWSDEVFRHYTERPGDSRYEELAFGLVEQLPPLWKEDPLAQALIVKSYLDKKGIYSRRSQHAEAADPTASFLFGDLTGYCVHFAHAATYLFRSLGIPARVAAGYAVEEGDRGTGSSLLLRGENAHAWPEIYLEGIGWVVMDPAPETSLDEPMAASDAKLKQMLGEMLRQKMGDDPLRDQLRERWSWSALLKKLALIVLVLLLIAYAIKAWRALMPFVAGRDQLYRVVYRAALDRLAGLGLARLPGESRERFAERSGSLAPTFRALTADHLAWSLGSRRRAEASAWRAGLAAIGRELKSRRPWWRRFLALLDPFTWLRAR